MPTDRTAADRLDEAVDALIAGHPIAVDVTLRPALHVAQLLRETLTPVPTGIRFQAGLAGRLHAPGLGERTLRAVGSPRGRLIAAGAVSSAAVGVGVTAYAVWRTGRRHGGASHRLLHR